MDIVFRTRQLYPDELRILKTLKTRKEKERATKIKFYHYIIAVISGVTFNYLATLTKIDFLGFLFGLVALFAYSFIVFTPYEVYKLKKRHAALLEELENYILKGTVDTCTINARRIVVAEEYEDEGDLFIIEYDVDKVLYLWDYDYNLRKKLPCLNFEIYEDKFCKLLGRQVYPLSTRVPAEIIDRKAKWAYMGTMGSPGHLATENVNFDKLVASYKCSV